MRGYLVLMSWVEEGQTMGYCDVMNKSLLQHHHIVITTQTGQTLSLTSLYNLNTLTLQTTLDSYSQGSRLELSELI